MSQYHLDTNHVVQLLLRDCVPTLGERARAEVLRLAASHEALAREWMADGQSADEAQRSFDCAIVEDLQQAAHDLFWDTTWPACPLHRRHPLWYDEIRQAWCCEQNRAVLVPLGGLTDFRPSAT